MRRQEAEHRFLEFNVQDFVVYFAQRERADRRRRVQQAPDGEHENL